jgi:hypothetical protein
LRSIPALARASRRYSLPRMKRRSNADHPLSTRPLPLTSLL